MVTFALFFCMLFMQYDILAHLCLRCRTSPTLNILLYNAIGGSGDELYGIGPASYYVKNLFLNLGLSWVLVLVISPFALLLSAVLAPAKKPFFTHAVVQGIVIYSQAAIWLLVLFSRPHKVRICGDVDCHHRTNGLLSLSQFMLYSYNVFYLCELYHIGGTLSVPNLPSTGVHWRVHPATGAQHPRPSAADR